MSALSRVRRFLPPGPAYLVSNVLPFLLFLPGIVCSLLKGYATFWDVEVPTWVYVAATIAAHPVFAVFKRVHESLAIRRDRISQGAVNLPNVELPSREILRKLSQSFSSGYPGEVFLPWAQKYGNSFMFTIFGERRIFTMEPEDVKTVLATKFPDFYKGPLLLDMWTDLLGTGVFNADGDIWKFHRGMTRPFFNKDRISDFDNFERHSISSISLIKERLRSGYPVEFQDVVSRFTLDSATEFLFGKDVESLSAGLPYPKSSGVANGAYYDNHPSNVFVNAFLAGQVAIAERSRFGKLWPLREFWKDKVSPHRKVVDGFVEPLMQEALSKKSKGYRVGDKDEEPNLLTTLVSETDDVLAIKDELINILVAGRDTTASLLTFAVYALTRHPEVMRTLREEIANTLGQRPPTYDDIRGMKYLKAVLNETLRLYPAVPFDSRTASKSTTLPRKGGESYHVPVGTRLMYSVFWMHRRRDLWGPTALEFDPDRFIDERVKFITKNPFIFLPFNAGPRICLGQQFAYNEASYFLVRLLQNFSSINIADEIQTRSPPEWASDATPGSTKSMDTIRFGIHLTMYAKDGLWVNMKEDVATNENE